MMKDPTVMEAGVWYEVAKEGQSFPMACCQCGYTHDVEVDVHEGKILMKVKPNKMMTNHIRRRGDAELFGKSTEYEIIKRRNK